MSLLGTAQTLPPAGSGGMGTVTKRSPHDVPFEPRLVTRAQQWSVFQGLRYE